MIYADPSYPWAPSRITLPSTTQYRFDYDFNGNIAGLIDAAGNRADLSWDGRNRLTQMLEPLVAGEAARRRTEYNYNARDNLIRIRRYTDASNFILTEYQYDKHGQVIQFINGLGKITHYSYDDHGNLTGIVTPMGRQTAWLYEDADQTFGFTRPNARIDGAGARINLLYDEWGRLRVKDYPSGADTLYSYDGLSRLTRMLDATGMTQWEYNANGWVSRVTKDKGWSVDYEYYPNGLRARMSETSSQVPRILDYTYTPRNELAAIIERGAPIQFSYDADGRLIRRQLPTGARMERSYTQGRLAQVTHYDAQNLALASYSYSYQANGLPRQLVEQDGSVTRYGYDFLNRLVREERTGGAAYDLQWAYDAVGNRLKQSRNGLPTAYTYDDDNRLLQASARGQGVSDYVWDANGRLSERSQPGERNQFAYDHAGNLVSIARWDGRSFTPLSAFRYDGLDRRVARQTFDQRGRPIDSITYRYDVWWKGGDGALSFTTYDPITGPLIAGEPSSPVVIREEVVNAGSGRESHFVPTWGQGLIAWRDESLGTSMWSMTDGSGSLRGWTDDRGQAGRYAAIFNAFGEAVFEQGQRPPYAFGADLGFRTDGDAGLVFTGQCYSAPRDAVPFWKRSYQGNINVHPAGCLCRRCLPPITPPPEPPQPEDGLWVLRDMARFILEGNMEALQRLLEEYRRKTLPPYNYDSDHPEEADVYLVFGTVEERELVRPAGPEIIIYEEPKKDRKKKEEGQPEKKAGEKEEKKDKSGRRETTVIRQRGPDYRELICGRGYVFKRLGEDRVRLVMEFKDTKQKSGLFERNPSTNFARKFVEAFRAANNLK